MSDLVEMRSGTATAPHAPRRNGSARRFALAGLFMMLVLGAALANAQWPSQVVPATLGFATAIMIIAATVVGWERQVDAAESAGLVKHYDRHPPES